MKWCPKCGSSVAEGSHFCGKCGASVGFTPTIQAPIQAPLVVCHFCGCYDVTEVVVSKKDEFVSCLLIALGLFIPVLGWIFLIVFFAMDTSTISRLYICKGCGKQWKHIPNAINNVDGVHKQRRKGAAAVIIIAVVLLVGAVLFGSYMACQNLFNQSTETGWGGYRTQAATTEEIIDESTLEPLALEDIITVYTGSLASSFYGIIIRPTDSFPENVDIHKLTFTCEEYPDMTAMKLYDAGNKTNVWIFQFTSRTMPDDEFVTITLTNPETLKRAGYVLEIASAEFPLQ